MRAKHTDELHVLEAKQAELETLDAMIDRLGGEFQDAPDAGVRSEPSPEAEPEDHEEAVEEASAEPLAMDVSLPEKLAVRYVTPNFRLFRRFA